MVQIGKLLGLIISPIVLSIVYLSVIMPIGIVFKIIRKILENHLILVKKLIGKINQPPHQ